ncbi:hypothetical protein QQS21_003874 [Conoideocrella luteorostrata]|uniref:Uncharacterized protein n=1 Tax=Conoideocrella luteorostrata TaxID=1105319 RepID=A0AAJ0FV71_9HYPO|nr:hypothetical protein QQS21_003874 [Conoideocrella luteorostrata]
MKEAMDFLPPSPEFEQPITVPFHLMPRSFFQTPAQSDERIIYEGTDMHHYNSRSVHRQSEHKKHDTYNTVAFALNINFIRRILAFNLPPFNPWRTTSLAAFTTETIRGRSKADWKGDLTAQPEASSRVNPARLRSLPVGPFKVLDAPNLRDDFYCSVLAYSLSFQTLAVGLGNVVYAWSDKEGVRAVNGVQQDGV